MKSKKAQGEVITTILIILLILAVVIIVWQVVRNTVQKGGEEITAGSECIGLELNIGQVTRNATGFVTVQVSRGADSAGVGDLTVKITGTGDSVSAGNSTGMGALDTRTVNATHSSLSTGDLTVLAAIKLTSTGKMCPGSTEKVTPT